MPSSPLFELSKQYALVLDQCNGEGAAALFVPEGALVVHAPPPSSEVVVHRGRASIAQRIDALRRYNSTNHVVGAHHADVLGEAASGVTECVAHHFGGEAGEGMDRVVHIRYEDSYTLREGTWHFVERHVVMLREDVLPVSGR